MVRTASTMLALGTAAPDFALPDVTSGQTLTLADFADQSALLVIFLCEHCPFVKHLEQELARLGHDYVPQGVGMVAISANDITLHPQDAPPHLKAMAERLGFNFPVCYDESQAVAKAYTAACTPDFFLFDRARTLVYRGQFDGSRPGNGVPITGADLRQALDRVLQGEAVNPDQQPSIGCNIKWRAGNAPAYFG